MGKTFISYSRTDEVFTKKLATELKDAGVDLWMDQLDIQPGRRWDMEIEKAMKSSQSMIVVLSPQAVASQNIMDEVSYALENNITPIPIVKQPCEVPFRLKRFQHIDFTEDYDDALAQLRTVLKSATASTTQPSSEHPTHATPASRQSGKSSPKWMYLGAAGLAVILIVSFFAFRNSSGGQETAANTTDSAGINVTAAPSQAAMVLSGAAVDSIFNRAYTEYYADNIRQSLELYLTADKYGNKQAAFHIGFIYLNNFSKVDSAMYWYEKSAQSGDINGLDDYVKLLSGSYPKVKTPANLIDKEAANRWREKLQ